jgi:hypothetical protein
MAIKEFVKGNATIKKWVMAILFKSEMVCMVPFYFSPLLQ